MKLTDKQHEALALVYERALDDWRNYRDSGWGPKAFGEKEWKEHVRNTDRALKVVRKDLLGWKS